ncbi:MAG TPA: hypothetical protein ENK43_06710 [Planctomycetes bacterium]|nr:hypothetical protein [Planctomycetota bacterium]
METFLRGFGWVVSLGWIYLFVDGVGWLGDRGLHLPLGLAVLLGALMLHSIPYFALGAWQTRLRRMARATEACDRALQRVTELKAKAFLPAAFMVPALIAGPILAFLELGKNVPMWTHGAFLGVLFLVHLRLWARHLFALGMARAFYRACESETE